MPTTNEFKPAVDARDPVLLRNALVKRVIYAIAPDEDPTDFVANTDGVTPLGLAYNGGVFWIDPDDLSSAHDGVTVIVTQDGYRYKVSDFAIPYAVLAFNATVPPVSPSIGDAYLTGSSPTGAWAGHEEKVAVWTSRGWVFVEPQVGRLLFVADGTNRWVYMDETGTIRERFDYQNATIPDGALIGGQRRFIVQSQTVNDPPGSPALGQYWIVGSAPTGAWSGQTANIATSYDGSTWVFIPAVAGLEAFDRANGANYIFRSGVGWTSAAGAWGSIVLGTGSGSTAPSGSSYYSGSGTPTTSHRHRLWGVNIVHQAQRTGVTLRLSTRLNPSLSIPGTAGDVTPVDFFVCVFRDSEANAIAWTPLTPSFTRLSSASGVQVIPRTQDITFILASTDTLSHTYRIAVLSRSTAMGVIDASTGIDGTLMLEESL